MPKLQRTSPFTVIAFGVVGVAVGLIVQFVLSARGEAPLVPPLSLPLTLVVLAAVLLWLGLVLRRAVTKTTAAVNPFHAVRLLAGAKAGQFSGALLGGFGAGLFLQLLTRSVMPPVSTWLPMLFVLIAGVVLVTCAVITETLCRVPPNDTEQDDDQATVADGA